MTEFTTLTPGSQDPKPTPSELQDHLRAQGLVIYKRIGKILDKEDIEGVGHVNRFDYEFTRSSRVEEGDISEEIRVFTHRYLGGPTNNPNRHIDTYKFAPDGTLLESTWYSENDQGQSTGNRDVNDPTVVDRTLWAVDGIMGRYDNDQRGPKLYEPHPLLGIDPTNEVIAFNTPTIEDHVGSRTRTTGRGALGRLIDRLKGANNRT